MFYFVPVSRPLKFCHACIVCHSFPKTTHPLSLLVSLYVFSATGAGKTNVAMLSILNILAQYRKERADEMMNEDESGKASKHEAEPSNTKHQSEATKQEQETRSMIPIYILVAVSLALQTIKQFYSSYNP